MNKAIASDHVVEMLAGALQEGEVGLHQAPTLLVKVIDDDAWQDRYIVRLKKDQHFDRFEDFVTTPPLEGLGTTIRQLRNICRDDPNALASIEKAVGNRKRGPKTEDILLYNVQSISPTGNTSARAIRKLSKDRPDLDAKVRQGKLSANAAMIQAGFRKPMASVPKTKEGFVSYIKRTFTPAEIRWIVEKLQGGSE